MIYAEKFINAQRQIAYKQGQKAHGNQVAKQQARARKNRSAEGTDTSKGKVHFEGDRAKLNKTQKASLGAMEVLAKALGVQIYVFESEVDENGNHVGANGWYDPSDGSIHIDLYAGNSGKGTMLFTVAHELAHFIKQWSPSRFERLANFLTKQYTAQGQSVSELVEAQQDKATRNGRELDYDAAYEEMVADSMESMLADGSIIEMMAELKQQDKGLWQKIKDWFKDLAGKIQAVVDAYKGVQPDSTEGRMVADMKDMISTMEALYMDALVDASENFDGGVQKITTEDSGGVKYQARKNGSMDDGEIQAVQSVGRKSVNAFTSADMKKTEGLARRYWAEMREKSPFFRAWFGDWRVNDQTLVQVANKAGDARGLQKNEDTGWDIQVSGMVFNETIRHTDSYNIAARPYLACINGIVKKAVLLDTHGVDQRKLKSPNTLLIHSLYAVGDVGNGPEIIKLYVEEMNNPNSFQTGKRTYQLQNVEKYQPQNGSSQKTASSISSATGSIRTVADLFTAVKQKDSSFNPKPAGKIVNDDGTPMVLYHGTSDHFT